MMLLSNYLYVYRRYDAYNTDSEYTQSEVIADRFELINDIKCNFIKINEIELLSSYMKKISISDIVTWNISIYFNKYNKIINAFNDHTQGMSFNQTDKLNRLIMKYINEKR